MTRRGVDRPIPGAGRRESGKSATGPDAGVGKCRTAIGGGGLASPFAGEPTGKSRKDPMKRAGRGAKAKRAGAKEPENGVKAQKAGAKEPEGA